MLWTILVFVLALWLVGLLFEIAGGVIHLLLLVAGAIFLYQLVTGRREVV